MRFDGAWRASRSGFRARRTPGRSVSRIRNDYQDRRLNPLVFAAIDEILGPIWIDLFANQANAQVARFVSLRWETRAWYVDAFSRSFRRKVLSSATHLSS